jgi:Tfp pilus assembly protein PilV
MDNFLTFNLGQLISIVVFIVTLSTFHYRNVARYTKEAEERQDVRNKLDEMYRWFNTHALDLSEIKIKVNLMYDTWIVNTTHKTKGGQGE